MEDWRLRRLRRNTAGTCGTEGKAELLCKRHGSAVEGTGVVVRWARRKAAGICGTEGAERSKTEET